MTLMIRQSIIDAAIELTARSGWSAVTMTRLAEAVGVSRQTVYNEVESKTALAEAMITHELGRFLAVVDSAFDRNPDDLVEAAYEAVRGVLELAENNILLRTIVSATHGTGTEFLPLLTIRAETLLGDAKTVLAKRIQAYQTPLDDRQLAVVVDLLVRTVLSHVMQPSDTPSHTADALAWTAARILDRAPRPTMRSQP
ncbi:MAG TPA: TetR family transcriptional regulator [Pseudonocardiaceae bacterium]|jgi:AcrR family transcriptional regulator|nr:TetR family transcriptional regulator [Pseudonocardiaceae bacterium]